MKSQSTRSDTRLRLTDDHVIESPFLTNADASLDAGATSDGAPVVHSQGEVLAWVSARLREWRVRRGMTQSAVADVSGLDQSSVSNYETGKRDIPIPAVLRLMATLNVSLGDLVDLSATPQGAEEVIVARDSLLGQAVASLIAGQQDIARAGQDLELTWQAAHLARSAVAEAARDGADVVAAALEAVSQALVLAEDRQLDRWQIARIAAQSAVTEAALISPGAARRVHEALDARQRDQPPD